MRARVRARVRPRSNPDLKPSRGRESPLAPRARCREARGRCCCGGGGGGCGGGGGGVCRAEAVERGRTRTLSLTLTLTLTLTLALALALTLTLTLALILTLILTLTLTPTPTLARPWSVDEGDLLGDLAVAAESGSGVDEGLQRDLEELLSTAQPTARLDAAHASSTSPRPACVQIPVAAATLGGGLGDSGLGGGLGNSGLGGGLGDMLDMSSPSLSSAAAHPACASSSGELCSAAPGSRGAPSIWSGAEASLLDLLDTPAAGHRRGPSAGAVLAPDVLDVLKAAAAPHAASALDEDFLRSLVGAGSGAPAPPVPPDARSPPCPALILP